MLETYLLSLGQCLKDATRFQTLGKDKAMNLSITWQSLSPLKTSTSPCTSLFTKYSERKTLLVAYAMADTIALGVRDASFSTKDLTCSNTSLEQPSRSATG